MKLKFRHKVFLTFLVNSLAIVICMVFIAGYYASRNFDTYVRKVEMEWLNQLVDTLSKEYRKSMSWESVLASPARWLHLPGLGHAPHRGATIAGRPPFPFPPVPPPIRSERNTVHTKKGEPPPPGDPSVFASGPPPPHGHKPPRLALLDAQKKLLTEADGSSADDYRLTPIRVDGRLVGWLGIRRPPHLRHPLELEYLRAQSQMFYTIGGVALLLAALVTFLLSRHLLTPVRELAQGARALTSRRFETRIKIRSQDELGQLATDFNTMAQALERYEQLRRQWMADISHELRTPLAILRGEIEAMQDGVREVDREALGSLHFEVLHVSRIVNDLHDLSLIESRTLDAELEVVNPLEVLGETLRSFRTRFEHRKIRIEMDGLEEIEANIIADRGRLTQLFSNLLENTLRYAHSPGVLKVSGEATSSGRLVIIFEDSGPGVPEDSLGLLFDRLYRVDKARSRAHGGSGLGLAICRGIVERFGGCIEASNAPSGGLRITMSFPLAHVTIPKP